MFTRNQLRDIRNKATDGMNTPNINALWKRAYEDLAISADRLDAMWSRCEVREDSDMTHAPKEILDVIIKEKTK